jgi:hypothetical protein
MGNPKIGFVNYKNIATQKAFNFRPLPPLSLPARESVVHVTGFFLTP